MSKSWSGGRVMATKVMVTWVLVLLVGWAGVFGFFNKYFDGADFERKRVARLESEGHRKDRQYAALQMNFSEYKDALAESGLKIDAGTAWSDPRRSIASVMASGLAKRIPGPTP